MCFKYLNVAKKNRNTEYNLNILCRVLKSFWTDIRSKYRYTLIWLTLNHTYYLLRENKTNTNVHTLFAILRIKRYNMS